MAETFKKALQPPHPSEKQAGKAISPPPCQHGVPVYPLRYGVTDKPLDSKLFPKLSTAGYPTLQGGKAYGVRVLRPGCYVYLCYMKDGRMWTQHYQVTKDVRFAPIWWTEADDKDAAPGRLAKPDEAGAQPWLLAPDDKVTDTVYLLVSDTVLTHRTLYRIETNEGGLRDKLTTQVKPAGGVQQSHTFQAFLVGSATVELVEPAFFGTPYGYSWSEVKLDNSVANSNRIISGMYSALMPCKDVIPLAVALQDTIGIASELGYLCSTAVKERDAYQARNKHKLQSAALIDTYFKQIDAAQGTKTPDDYKAIQKKKDLIDLRGVRAFKPAYDKNLKALEPPIKHTGADVVAWMRLLDKSKLLDTALRTFDLSCVRNANDYEIAVLNCIGASVHTDDGLKELAKLIEAEPKLSPLWKALGGGDDPLMDRLSRYLTVARAVFTVADSYVDARAATAATNILASLVQHYVVTAPTEMAKVQVLRLRHVSERRFNVTLGYTEVTLEQFARYAVEMEGYRALGPDVFARWHLEITQGPGSLPGTMQTKGSAHIEVWEWETIGAATVQTAAHASSRPIPATGNPLLRNAKRLRDMVTVKADSVRGPAGVLFTGIGGVLAAWTMRGAVKDVRGGANPTTVAAIIGASFGVIGSGIEITTLGLSIYIKRQGNAALAKTIATLGFKWGTTYAGTAAAAIMAVADSVRAANAYNDSNPEQAKFYLYSALAGSAVALATFAGGSATLATMAAGGGGAVAVLGLTPVGWFVIAVAATAAVVYFSWKAINAQHDPTDVWLKHSAWGVHTKHYTLDEELKAWHSLHFRPRLSATWESDSGKLGTLRLRVTLPSSDSVDDLRTDIKVTLRGTALKPVSPGLQGNYIDIDHQYAVRPIFDNSYSVERGYYISMHEDARVEFSYLYRPFLLTAPDIGLEQQGTPKPLVFTSGGWFSDPIDPSKIAVVEDPQ